MNNKHSKINYLIFSFIPMLLLYHIYINITHGLDNFFDYFSIIIAIIVILLISRLIYHFKRRRAIILRIWLVQSLFTLYCIHLCYLLFFSSEYARGGMILNHDYLDALAHQFEYNTNFIPFNTISRMLMIFSIDHISNSIAYINLFGNLLLFMPMALFLPMIFPSMRKKNIFIVTLALCIIGVELLQFITCRGSMDIDDFILNFSGALFIYLPFNHFVTHL